MNVAVGAHNIHPWKGRNETTLKRHKVRRFVVHEKYLKEKPSYDIALVQLDSPIKYNKAVRPICVDATEVQYNTKCVVTGWGWTSYESQTLYSLVQALFLSQL